MSFICNYKCWIVLLSILVFLPRQACAQYTILNSSFSNSTGAIPKGIPVLGPDGNFYGTTYQGGTGNAGTVFKVTPQGTLTVLHNFNDGTVANDGQIPYAGLVCDSQGNFYGTTSKGGGTGCQGTAFKISSTGSYTVLHRFLTSSEGNYILSPLIIGQDGLLYGSATLGAGTGNPGCIFKMTLQGTVSVLYQFGSVAKDGMYPGDLMQASNGKFYGMTFSGGTNNLGIIFSLTTAGVKTTLVNFSSVAFDPNANTAIVPSAFIMGNDGYLYGSTPGHASGLYDDGVVYKMSTNGSLAILANITCSGPLFQAADGNFYTSTAKGGGGNDVGGFVRITPQGSVTYLHNWESLNFDGIGGEGTTQTSDGAFYGFTTSGGSNSYGTMYKVAFAPPTFTSSAPPDGTVNTTYSFTLTGTGFPAPSFSIASGSLPPGLTLFAYGGLSGTPTTGGLYTGTITASNGASPNATQSFSITVGQSPAITVSPLSVSLSSGSTYSFSYQASGYPAPTFTLTSGSLPPGLTLSSSGVLSGIATQVGIYSGVITASNGNGTPATQTFSITISPSTDTPTMPVWGLIILTGLLLAVAAVYLSKPSTV